jgi:hypothetical protein
MRLDRIKEMLAKYIKEGDETNNWDWYAFMTDYPELADTPLAQAYRDLMLADFRFIMHLDSLFSQIPGYISELGEVKKKPLNLTEAYFGDE